MTHYHFIQKFFGIGLLALAAAGCSGGSSSDDVAVVDISPGSRSIQVGEATVTKVDITYDAGRISGGENIHLIIRLPSQLGYVQGSAEIDGFTSQDDNPETPNVSSCPNGDQFLAFEFSSVDLGRAFNPAGDGDMRLTLTLNGVAVGANVVVQARAEDFIPSYGCDANFESNTETTLTVNS